MPKHTKILGPIYHLLQNLSTDEDFILCHGIPFYIASFLFGQKANLIDRDVFNLHLNLILVYHTLTSRFVVT